MFSLIGAAALTAAISSSQHSVVVQPGDTLSAIGAATHTSWRADCAASHIPDCNLIRAGQVIILAVGTSARTGSPDGDGDHDGDISDGTLAPHAAPPRPAMAGGSAPSGFRQCVLRRESGGNYHAVNASSGAGGAYQFLPSTWAALGYSGLPQNASPAMQDQAFQKAYAMWGTQPWAPSDGC